MPEEFSTYTSRIICTMTSRHNIVIDFVNKKPNPVIIDFGKSCHSTKGRTKFVPPLKRAEYLEHHSHIAPETITGVCTESVNSDVYSLGKVFERVCT